MATGTTALSVSESRSVDRQQQDEKCSSASAAQKKEDKKLFTPGPLSVSQTVKEAMLRDLGSRDVEFINLVKDIRSRLLQIAGVTEKDFTCVTMQGSGTFALDGVFQTAVPRDNNSKVLILRNGAYGKRMAQICEAASIPHHMETFPDTDRLNLERVAQLLLQEKEQYGLVCCVHCESSSGVINPVEDVGRLVKAHSPGTLFLVDAMSSFGAVPLDLEAGQVDFMVSSPNKCLQGVPGFSYTVARKSALATCRGNSRSLSLDLYDQNETLDKTGQFRFTPPTHVMLAFGQALRELEQEGGVEGRAKRYAENRRVLAAGMKRLGFKQLLDDSVQGYIVTSYHYPKDPHFSFPDFHNRLKEKGKVLHPGKKLDVDCFRIGSIGHLFPQDMEKLLQCVEEVCRDMNMALPVNN